MKKEKSDSNKIAYGLMGGLLYGCIIEQCGIRLDWWIIRWKFA